MDIVELIGRLNVFAGSYLGGYTGKYTADYWIDAIEEIDSYPDRCGCIAEAESDFFLLVEGMDSSERMTMVEPSFDEPDPPFQNTLNRSVWAAYIDYGRAGKDDPMGLADFANMLTGNGKLALLAASVLDPELFEEFPEDCKNSIFEGERDSRFVKKRKALKEALDRLARDIREYPESYRFVFDDLRAEWE